MRSRLAFGVFGGEARHKAALALYVITYAFGLGLSAKGQDWNRKPLIITFDAPGVGTGEYQGTYPQGINRYGEIVGFSIDANGVLHAFLRAPNGTFTIVDAPGASQKMVRRPTPSTRTEP
jgi:probable HAF family extracellular repeat protein